MSPILQDLRYGVRMMAKNPGVTVVAALAMALGIGANTSIFTVVNSLLLHPLPFAHIDRLVVVWETAPRQNEYRAAPAPGNFRDWQEQSHSFEELAAGHGWEVNVTGAGPAERLDGYQVTPTFFTLLGMQAWLGRTIGASDFESRRAGVAVVSYGFWQQRLGGRADVIGSKVRLNGSEHTVVGVMPRDFEYPVGVDIWGPLDLQPADQANRTEHYLQVIGRLKPETPMARAQADLEAIAGGLAQRFPATNAGHSVRLVGLVNDMLQGSRQFILVLMGAAGFVLLLACANVANLQLAQGSSRQMEIAVRVAMGASRGRVARQLLIESVLQSLLGAAAGLSLASWDLQRQRNSIPAFILQHVPGLRNERIDGYVLAFTAAVAVAAGILAGVAFAWHASRADLNETLKESSRGAGPSSSSHRLRGLLVVAEVALALVLLTGAGLMVKGFRRLANTNLGFDRQNVLTFQIALPESKYRDPSRVREFYDRLVERLDALPGVESAAASLTLPGQWDWNRTQYTAEGQAPAAAGEMRIAGLEVGTPEIFRVLRIPVVRGRVFTSQDATDRAQVVVLNASLAKRLWPDESPVGKRVRFGAGTAPWCTVVGVVGDIAIDPVERSTPPIAYFPLSQLAYNSMSLALRTSGDPMEIAKVARAQVQALDPEQPVFDMRTLEKVIDDDLSGVEMAARMMTIYGFIALVLSASGIFALMAYSVSQRVHEFGVRMALGAQGRDVLRMVVVRAAVLALLGLLIGVPAALAMTHALSSALLGIIRIDLPVFAGFTLVLALAALAAAYIPARRAMRIDPMEALRHE